MSSVLIAAGDLHLDARHLTTHEHQRQALAQLVAIVERERADVVLLAGDVMDSNRPSAAGLELAGALFSELAVLGVPVVITPGNHDPDQRAIAQHFRGEVYAPASASIVEVRGRNGQRIDVACLPYLPDRYVRAQLRGAATKEDVARELTAAAAALIDGMLTQRRASMPFVFVGHGTVAGSVTESGWNMGFLGGTEWRLDPLQLARFDFAAVGHIHKHQAPAANVVVPGSILPLDFSEVEPKGVIVAEVSSGSFHGRTIAPSWRFETIEVETPETYRWDAIARPDEALALQAMATGQGHATPTGELVRVVARVTEDQARRIPVAGLERAYRDAGAQRVKVEMDVVHEDRQRDAGMTVDLGVGSALRRYLGDDPHELYGRGAEQWAALMRSGDDPIGEVGDLELLRIEASDFLGVERADVRMNADVLTVAGQVGSGKSAIGADAVRFALFGVSRYGSRNLERVVRAGSRLATVRVTFLTPSGDLYAITRKVQLSAAGRPTSTLDVLKNANGRVVKAEHWNTLPPEWEPLSDGKVASGEAAIARILGGINDEVLTVANLVMQRDADGWTADAKPEDRRRLLAAAAGLSVYDQLAGDARARAAEADKGLGAARTLVTTLEARAHRLAEHRGWLTDAKRDQGEAADRERAARAVVDDVEHKLRRERERLENWRELDAKVRDAQRRIDEGEAERVRLNGRKQRAQEALAAPAPGEGAHKEATLALADAETAHDRAQQTVAARARALESRADLERQRSAHYAERERGRGVLIGEVTAAARAAERLKDSGCPIIDDISFGRTPPCAFLKDAGDAAALDKLRADLRLYEQPGQDEARLAAEAAAIDIPAAPDVAAAARVLAAARARVTALEDAAQRDRDARATARANIKDAEAGLEALGPKVKAATSDKVKAAQAMIGFGGSPAAAVPRLEGELAAARDTLHVCEVHRHDAERRIAGFEAVIAELAGSDDAVGAARADVERLTVDAGAWAKLADAWKAVRVMVLETSVIPAVERTANELLARFPYGLSIGLRTQRATQAGGQAEALDVEVLGGMAPVYEGCSGGQRTTIDLALHVAIALIVSRRSSTRLRYLFVDEPEGLDEQGRHALAGIVQWIAATFSLRVLVASHHEDLVGAVAGETVTIGGEPGAAVIEHGEPS